MASHTFYIACSYLALALAIVWELWSLRRLRAASLRRVRDEQALDHDAQAQADAAVLSNKRAQAARQPGISPR